MIDAGGAVEGGKDEADAAERSADTEARGPFQVALEAEEEERR